MTQKKTLQSSISSQESEGSASDSKQQKLFQQLPSVSKTNSAKPSYERTGQTLQSLTTSEPCQQIDLEELTSVSVDSLASLGAQQGKSEAQKMTAISGQKCCELLKLYNLSSSLARTCVGLLTSRWVSDAVYLTWKASGIKPSHLLFHLAVSTPHIEETAVGSSDTRMWPTPRASEWKDTGPVGSKSWKHMNERDYLSAKAKNPEQPNGQLNSAWVSRLMGYPDGWLEIGSEAFQELRKAKKAGQ